MKKFRKIKHKGFTLLEILVVIGIITVAFLFSVPMLARRQPLTKLDMVSSEMLSILRQAQNQTLTRKASSTWGVYFDESNQSVYMMYAGTSYQNRNQAHDLSIDMGDAISWQLDSEANDIIFSALNGFPVATATVMIKHDDFADVKILNINQVGKIERDD